jgi:hypothetical protein
MSFTDKELKNIKITWKRLNKKDKIYKSLISNKPNLEKDSPEKVRDWLKSFVKLLTTP